MKFLKIKLLFSIIAIISFIICLIANTTNGYDWLFLIPVTYFFSNSVDLILNKLSKKQYKNVGITVINIIAFIKFSLMPIIIVSIKDYYGGVLTGQIPSAYYLHQGILLTCMECISIFFTMIIFFLIKSKRKTEKENTQIIKKIKFGPVMMAIFIISILLIIKFSDAFFPTDLFIMSEDYEAVTIDSSVDGLVKIFFNMFKVFGLLYFLQFFSQKYLEKKQFKYIIGMLVIVLIYLALNLSVSRWNIVIPVIAVLFILKEVWFKTTMNKVAITIIILTLATSFISISQNKFNWLVKDQGDSLHRLMYVFGGEMQEYFSGPRAIAQGIESYKIYNHSITYTTLFNDFTGSIPFVSHYIDQSDRINIYYNYFLKGTNDEATQIMPMITVGLSYFGYGLCYIFIVISIICSCMFGEKVDNCNNIFEKYIYMFGTIWFAMCLGFNTQIIFGWIMSSFIPFILIFKLNNKIIAKKKGD